MNSLTVNKAAAQKSYQQLTINGIGKVQRATIGGREYFVAPMTSIVPGVLPGSRGALLYPHTEIQNSVPAWNGVPITIGHPYDPISGRHLSAKDDGVINRQGIGFIGGTQFNGKLTHLGYFDVEQTRRKSKEIYNALLKNQVMEISSGLYTDNASAEPGATYNGRPYDAVARMYVPDHMAVLVREKGACSISDGCGLLVNAEQIQNAATDKDGCAGDS